MDKALCKQTTTSVSPEPAEPEREPLQTYQDERIAQWREVGPELARRLEDLLGAVADAEAVLRLSSAVVGLLATDEAGRDWAAPDRDAVLSHRQRLSLFAGVEVAARLSADVLTNLHFDAQDRMLAAQREATGGAR